MSIDRIGIHFGPLYLHFYGVLIMTGVVIAALLSYRRAKNKGEIPELVWDMVLWLVIAGVIGARLWHIFTPSATLIEAGITTRYYLTHPLDALAIWNGGLGIPGAVIGGVIALWLFSRRQQLNFGRWCDIVVPGLAIAQAIGRWGNFINQELYGRPSDLPWSIFIDPEFRIPGYRNISNYHPLFLYEYIWNLGNACFLLWAEKKFHHQLKDGDLIFLYLIIYPFGRFWLEFLRLDPSPVGVVNINQTIMGIIAVCAAVILFLRHRPTKKTISE
ncbi:MAG: prolipoprotein diacylglyceryl transferase [Anaerolineaceae bacterium]|nr:prolipoprotein diacylglyceryl transferase [Anaerolineaceae bacterium]